ncbi:hypothetical protein [Bathymodiolus thermophilus thioautotrophic gill symbiont]|uniref:hypothetical protein n=1 Tax=Bathymodiolus thermophilus thioautotrophic gill symbiont TaxID=2360 RepID=UPI00192CE338|nr:hypothetical protein [Bathymodiolus thermophilus thioautotrophic gill symbiont]
MSNHQESTFHPLGKFLNPTLVLLGQSLKKSPIWNFANYPCLYKNPYRARHLKFGNFIF